MTHNEVTPGTQGYADAAQSLFVRDAGITFTEKHRPILHLLPSKPAAVVDIGSGTGADANWLASLGHSVVAVEPTEELRLPSMERYPGKSIEWINDCLPRLEVLRARAQRFRLVMLSAVWMHLNQGERELAMPNVASLLTPDGVLIISLRHGPVPNGRRMFDVSGEETIRLARRHHLQDILSIHTESVQRENRLAGVTWTRLAFVGLANHIGRHTHRT